jgi:hypothetical protein
MRAAPGEASPIAAVELAFDGSKVLPGASFAVPPLLAALDAERPSERWLPALDDGSAPAARNHQLSPSR